MTIGILGTGMIGRAIALDLAKDHDVHAFDLSKDNLDLLHERNPSIKVASADLNRYVDYPDLLKPFDLVIIAVPGFMGFKTLEAAIKAGKNIVDISFFPEDAMLLDPIAKKMGVTVITDCGVAPGMSNLILGRYNVEMKVEEFECYVGGLPKERKPPFEYKAPFSPIDVIEEYTRPARLVENGSIVVKPALSDRERITFEEVGELEAFNTDGLRSLVYTMNHIPHMKEKTLRYPGHIDLIIALKQAGFFNTTPIGIGEINVIPLEFTSKLLVNEWKLEPDEDEFTVMKVIVRGTKDGKPYGVEWNLLDRYEPVSRLSSMARTTGFTCTGAAGLILKGMFTEKGVFPPELVGKDKSCFDYILNHLKERKVNWRHSEINA